MPETDVPPTADALQTVMVDAWPPLERTALGDWVLRAARGFTGRANSALAVGDPGVPLTAAVTHVETWYAARGLPPTVTLVGAVDADLTDAPLGRMLLGRGYLAAPRTLTLTAHVDDLPAPDQAAALDLTLTGALSPAWFAAFADYRPLDEEAARGILTGSPHQVFAQVVDRAGDGHDGGAIAIGRLGLGRAHPTHDPHGPTWAGIAAMWVHPDHRRQRLGSSLLVALAAEARRRGIRSLHLQVDAANHAARALYAAHGFTAHHQYRAFAAPTTCR